MNQEKKLQVKDLTISFRTVNGKVQAVRDISFDLYKGETLAIVGESGSGKSVTSKAILGISANNAMIEGGKILYDGKDLLRISEDDFHSIRGDKIAMVFQDPLSSLNPIMRIGKQLTEAMILKSKTNRRESKKNLRATIRRLDDSITKAEGSSDRSMFDAFNKVIEFQEKYEAPYDVAYGSAAAALKSADDLLLEMDRESVSDVVAECRELKENAAMAVDRFVVHEKADELKNLVGGLMSQARAAKSKDYAELEKTVLAIRDILAEATEEEQPDFFALGCYMQAGGALPEGGNAQVNAVTAQALEGELLTKFKTRTQAGLRYSFQQALEGKKKVVELLSAKRDVFEKPDNGAAFKLDRSQANALVDEMTKAVEASIDHLEPVKDSLAWTFGVSIRSSVNAIFASEKKNRAEQQRFDKQTAKYNRQASKGKEPDWKVAPLSLVDQDRLRQDALDILDSLREHYEEFIAAADGTDFAAKTDRIIEWFKEMALGSRHRLTRSMAKTNAIKLMESVGISEARKRYRQYPFEFSGGMRQRIVIAISLTANPDVLICDEPTTALDVTIQAQILDLINDLKKQRDLSVVFITHDLGVVAHMADRIAVMYAGKIVEYGTAADIFYHPAHPYTWALLSSVPDLNTSERLESIPGTPPNMIYPPVGDAFAARNKYAMEIDFEAQPPMFELSDTHYAATWLCHPDAPKVEPPKIVLDRIARMTGKGGDVNG